MNAELQRLATTAERLILRPMPAPDWSKQLPKVGELTTYIRTGRVRRASGYVKEHAPAPLLAVRVEPQHPGWTDIWVKIEEIKAAEKGGPDAA